MRIVICGAGSTGRHIAELMHDWHDVALIDRAADALGEAADGAHFVVGDAADPETLLRAGADHADAVIAVTRDDPTNLTVSLLAKRRFGAGTTVARVTDPSHRWLFTPEAGVDVAVSSAELLARVVQEEVTAGDLVTLLRLRGHGVAVTETTLPPGAASAGATVAQLALPAGVVVSAIVRDEAVLLPERAGTLRAGDVVVALCEPGTEHVLHHILNGGT